ncbi:MAG: hypothetical protein AB7K68_14665 [Bacteriovoracia bacterium]
MSSYSQAWKTIQTPAIFALGLGLVFSPLAFAISQADAQHTASTTNRRGSDDDQDEAYRNAMKAFMNLAALNIPGAISKGYEAYGNYINSEKLDDLEAKTKRLKGLMTSADTAGLLSGVTGAKGLAANDKDSGVSGKKNVTTLSRLDPSFMYKGETAAVAEEFEKRSGMKREEFFKHLAAATDAQYTYDDPELYSKLEQRFQAFKASIPNKDFRDGLERAENLVPVAIRQKMLGEAMAFYKDSWKNTGSQVAAAPTAPSTEPAAPNVVASAPNPPAVAEAPKTERAPASTAPEKQGSYPDKMGFYIGLKDNPDALKDFMQADNLMADNETIFKTVSARYRKLTPGLVAKKNLVDSR